MKAGAWEGKVQHLAPHLAELWVPAAEMPLESRDLLFPSHCGAESALPEPGVPAAPKGREEGMVSLRAGAALSVPVGEVKEVSGKPSRAALGWSNSRGITPTRGRRWNE